MEKIKEDFNIHRALLAFYPPKLIKSSSISINSHKLIRQRIRKLLISATMLPTFFDKLCEENTQSFGLFPPLIFLPNSEKFLSKLRARRVEKVTFHLQFSSDFESVWSENHSRESQKLLNFLFYLFKVEK